MEPRVGRMRSRAATRLVWFLCALSLLLMVLSLILLTLNYSHSKTNVYGFWPENTVFTISFSIIGAIIASRLPANPLGWLFCAAGIVSAVAHFSGEYAIYALLAQTDTLPGVKRWPGLPLGCGFCSSACWCFRSYCFLMGNCRAGILSRSNR